MHNTTIGLLGMEEGRKISVSTSLSTAKVIQQRDRNQELGRNSLLFRDTSQGVFKLQKHHINLSPPQCCTYTYRCSNKGHSSSYFIENKTLTLMLLVANLANTK